MALFGKKKRSIDELIEDIAELSEDEKSKLLAMLNGENQAEEQPVEEEPVEEVSEEVEQEELVEETPKEEVQSEPVEQEGKEEPVQQEEENAEEVLPESESATDEMANDNRDEIIHQLVDKVNGLSEQIKGLLDLKELMEEYTSKQADNFGFKGNVLGAKKDYKDMSADELKAHVMKGI